MSSGLQFIYFLMWNLYYFVIENSLYCGEIFVVKKINKH